MLAACADAGTVRRMPPVIPTPTRRRVVAVAVVALAAGLTAATHTADADTDAPAPIEIPDWHLEPVPPFAASSAAGEPSVLPGVAERWEDMDGATPTVAVIDSGVLDEGAIEGRVVGGYDFTEDEPMPDGGVDASGHGTTVAHLLAGDPDSGPAGACPQCDIVPYRVFGDDGTPVTLDELAAAIDLAVADGADVINMSLTTPTGYAPVADAVADAAAAGVAVVASAGNDGVSLQHYPAAHTGAFAIGGTTSPDPWETEQRHPSSNYGPWVDVAAPYCNLVPDYGHSICGTSGSAPLAAGGVAVLAAASDASAGTVLDAFSETADPELPWAADGTVDADAAWQHLTSDGGQDDDGDAGDDSNEDDATPAPVDGLSAEPIPGGLTLDWETSEGGVRYDVTVANADDGVVVDETVDVPPFAATGLPDHLDHLVEVRARDDEATGPWTEIVATPGEDTALGPAVQWDDDGGFEQLAD